MQTILHHNPLISVVIPTFNRANFLRRAIQSVLKQTFVDFEIIVVDDASTDNTVNVVEEFSEPRIRLIRLDRNYGGGHARNQGIQVARAELVAFLDSDDEWMPRKLELQMERLRSSYDPCIGVVYCLGYDYQELTKRKRLMQFFPYEGDVFSYLLKGGWHLTTSTVMVKRSSLVSVGGFDERLPSFQDTDLWMRLAEASNHFVAITEPLVIRHIHNSSRITSDLDAKLKGLQMFEERWREVVQARCGSKSYHQWVAGHWSDLRFNQLQKAVANGNRSLAWHHCLALSQFLPWSGRTMLNGLLLVLLGQEGYVALARKKDIFFPT